MRRLVLLASVLGCNAWIRPTPPQAGDRTSDVQQQSAVTVTSRCAPFENSAIDDVFVDDARANSALEDLDPGLTTVKTGSGVMVSDWQVLTAYHVVSCMGAIARITVTNYKGQSWSFVWERQWLVPGLYEDDGVVRIQMASADHLSPRLRPPTVASELADTGSPLYLQSAYPEAREHIGEATGWSYHEGRTFTYRMRTEKGNSGSGIYDMQGRLVGIHLGAAPTYSSGAVVTQDMVPHR